MLLSAGLLSLLVAVLRSEVSHRPARGKEEAGRRLGVNEAEAR